eukprot:441422_1
MFSTNISCKICEMNIKMIWLIVVLVIYNISISNGETVWKRTEYADDAVVMKCFETDKCNPVEDMKSIYESPLISIHTHYSLKIIQYSNSILFSLIDNDNLFEYINISHSTNDLYQSHTAKEIIEFIVSSTKESQSGEITSSLTQQTDESILLTIYIRYKILNRDIVLLFTKQNQNETQFMNKLLQQFNHYKNNMDAKIDILSQEIDRLKEENKKLQYQLKNVNVPKGMILMFHGEINNIPNGYLLCDGLYGTPDLRDKFIVGAGNVYNVGEIGGNSHHGHSTYIQSEIVDIESVEVRVGGKGHKHKHRHRHHDGKGPQKKMINVITDQKGKHSHETTMDESDHLPPFYATIFIMKK